jgi:putative transposase
VNRQFTVDAPDKLWVSDITEHGTDTGKVYLGVVIDAFSRRVIGWSIADQLGAELVVDALQMAIWRRNQPEGTIVHSDHGTPIHVMDVQPTCARCWPCAPLGTIGDVFDKRPMVESFWARMQTELLDTRKWKTRVELSSAIFDWIEVFYNRTRRHSALGMMSPVAYEKLHSQHTNVA